MYDKLNTNYVQIEKDINDYRILLLKPLDKQIILTEDLFIGDPKIIKKYKCLLCSNIVKEPLQCGECENLFCEKCISNHLENYNSCPNCKDEPFKQIKLSKFIKLQLEELEFNCPFDCGEKLGYYELENHRIACVNLENFYKCNLCQTFLNHEEDMEEKHKLDCENLKVKCDICFQELNKFDYKEHLNNCENYCYFCTNCKINYNRINKEPHDHLCIEITKYVDQISNLIRNIRDLN